MAVQPLSPATHRRLGGPLPHQLSNGTRAHLYAINLWHSHHAMSVCYTVLASVSRRYPVHRGRLLTRYSPVRHWSGAEAPSPFDLNVLCTPPAFILSQDQTLECLYYILHSQVTIFLSELFYLSFFYFLEYIYSLTRSVFSHLLMLCTSLFVVQFSMTVCRPSGQLDYYTTINSDLSTLFFNFFSFLWFLLFFDKWWPRLSYFSCHFAF